LFVVCILGLASGSAQSVDVLLIAPDDVTLAPVRSKLTKLDHETRAGWEFWIGELGGKKVVLTRSEDDALNAVAATTLAVRRHPPRLIVVFGPCRAHDPNAHPGDIVVSHGFAAFDGMVSPVTALDGGSDALRWHKLPHLAMTAGEKETPMELFPADAAAEALALTLPVAGGRAMAGILGSGNQVNREADRIAWLREQWHTTTEDGESGHVAGCAYLLGVPCIGFRSVDGTADVAAFTSQFVEAWR